MDQQQTYFWPVVEAVEAVHGIQKVLMEDQVAVELLALLVVKL